MPAAIDLVFPHHENEIAQSEAATGLPFVRHWFHTEFLMVEGQKMSKSLGNFFTLQRPARDRAIRPAAIRYLLLSVHYRKQLNFTMEGLEQAGAALQRVNDFVLRIREVTSSTPENQDLTERIKRARREFQQGLDDDLNTSVALAALFELIRETNILLDRREVGAANRDEILALFSDANLVFDVFQIAEQRLDDEEILRLIDERIQARRNRNFSQADQIRDALVRRGIALEDTKDGTRWKRVT